MAKFQAKKMISTSAFPLYYVTRAPSPFSSRHTSFPSVVDVKNPLVVLHVPHHTQLDFGFAEPTTESMKTNFLAQLISEPDLVTPAKLISTNFQVQPGTDNLEFSYTNTVLNRGC